MWAWQKQFVESTGGTDPELTSITALSVNPAGTKVACYGYHWPMTDKIKYPSSSVGFVFLLDTSNGAIVSNLLEMRHDTEKYYQVQSRGFLLLDNGEVFFTLGTPVQETNPQLAPQLVRYDSVLHQVKYHKESAKGYISAGVAASLVQGTGSASDYLYIGGNVKRSQWNTWSPAVYKIDPNQGQTGEPLQTQLTRIMFQWWLEPECDDEKDDGVDVTAAYISHLGFMTDTTTGNQLFGLTTANDYGTHKTGKNIRVFRVEVENDTSGDLTQNIQMKEIAQSDFLDTSYFIGLRPQMEFEVDKYYIHCAYANSQDKKSVYYLRISPDSGSVITFYAHKLSSRHNSLGIEAVFSKSTTMQLIGLNNQYQAYQAYWVGSKNKYDPKIGVTESWGHFSFIVAPTFADDSNCLVQAENVDVSLLTEQIGCRETRSEDQDWSDNSDTQFIYTNSLIVRDLDFTKAYIESLCNEGDDLAVVSVASDPIPLQDHCYNYQNGSTGLTFFNPPYISDPATCTDGLWLYSINSLQWPQGIQISFDQTLNTISWSRNPGEPFLGMQYETYTFNLKAILPTKTNFFQLDLLTFNIKLDCCAFPTVITLPSPPLDFYTYTIGDSVQGSPEAILEVALSNEMYLGDNTCCKLAVMPPNFTVSPTYMDPVVWELQNPSTIVHYESYAFGESNIVPSSDSLITTYTVTYQPLLEAGYCHDVPNNVNYQVEIKNRCLDAIIIIDPSFSTFKDLSQMTEVHDLNQGPTQISWNLYTVAQVNQHCGSLITELWDVTTGIEEVLDPTIFTFTENQNGQSNLLIETNVNDVSLAQVHRILYRVKLEALSDQVFAEREFNVEIRDPCIASTFRIDDTIFKPVPQISMTQYVGYEALSIAWTDSIVIESIAFPEICGPLTHQLYDYNTGTEEPMNENIFLDIELERVKKAFSCQTDDFNDVKDYTLLIVVYYENYKAHPEYSYTSKSFKVAIQDYCQPMQINIISSFQPAFLQYTIGDDIEPGQQIAQMDSVWTTVPIVCNIEYRLTLKSWPGTTFDPNFFIFQNDPENKKVIVEVTEKDKVFYGGNNNYLPGIYTVEVRTWADNNYDTGYFKELVIEILDPCLQAMLNIDPNDTVFKPVTEVSLTQFVGYAPVKLEWTNNIIQKYQSVDCGPISHELWNANGDSQIDAQVFTTNNLNEEQKKSLSVFTNKYGKVGIYELKLSVFYAAYTSYPELVKYNRTFTVEVVGYCMPEQVYNMTQFQPNELNYKIGSSQIQKSSFAPNWGTKPKICNLIFKLKVISDIMPPDTSLQNIPKFPIPSSQDQEAKIEVSIGHNKLYYADQQILDVSQSSPGNYTLILEAYADNNFNTGQFTSLQIQIEDPCLEIQVPQSPLAMQIYKIGSNTLRLSVLLLSDTFKDYASMCGSLQFTEAQLLYSNLDDSSDAKEVIQMNRDSSYVHFYEDGSLQIYTNDAIHQGLYELSFQAQLKRNPEIRTSTQTILPIEFIICQVRVHQWSIGDATVPAGLEEAIQIFDEPLFAYTESLVKCNYIWYNFELTSVIYEQNGQTLQNPSNYIVLDGNKKRLQYYNNHQTNQQQEALIFIVTLSAYLSDNVTVTRTKFRVTFIELEIDQVFYQQNRAPQFLVNVQNEYIRKKANLLDEQKNIKDIAIGQIYDLDFGDQVSVDLKCLNDLQTDVVPQSYFSYNESKGVVEIASHTPLGIYQIELTAKDDNIEDPKSTTVSFFVFIMEPDTPEFLQKFLNQMTVDEDKKEKDSNPNMKLLPKGDPPDFKVSSTQISNLGELVVHFSQDMRLVEDLSLVNEDILSLKVLPDESNVTNDSDAFDFDWKVTEQGTRYMKIQIDWEYNYQISAGLQRDRLQLMVKNPEYFFSATSHQNIRQDASLIVKIPKMMQNDEFTKQFTEITESAQDFTNVFLIGNFFANLILSGAMTFLWGLLNCLQIISHFDLVNIMMPANAQQVFQLIIKTATLNILPTEDFINEIETLTGIENDDFVLTESFADFEFTSSGPIHNLQIMFLAIVLLATIPIFIYALKLAFLCNKRCSGCIDSLHRKIFFNCYIRFGLEAYLELSLSSLIRFKRYRFDDHNERFHSIFSTMILIYVIGFLFFSLFFLQSRYPTLNEESSRNRFGALYLGLKTRERTAILSPFIFMLRRLLYAAILVNWSERNYFQIQTIIFKCSLVMIYTGYMRPFEMTLANNLELINDTVIILCSYFLIIFSPMVADAYTRYTCGWPIISLICFIVILNLTIITYQALKIVIRDCYLRYKRRKNLRMRRKRVQNIMLQNHQQEAVVKDKVRKLSEKRGFKGEHRSQSMPPTMRPESQERKEKLFPDQAAIRNILIKGGQNLKVRDYLPANDDKSLRYKVSQSSLLEPTTPAKDSQANQSQQMLQSQPKTNNVAITAKKVVSNAKNALPQQQQDSRSGVPPEFALMTGTRNQHSLIVESIQHNSELLKAKRSAAVAAANSRQFQQHPSVKKQDTYQAGQGHVKNKIVNQIGIPSLKSAYSSAAGALSGSKQLSSVSCCGSPLENIDRKTLRGRMRLAKAITSMATSNNPNNHNHGGSGEVDIDDLDANLNRHEQSKDHPYGVMQSRFAPQNIHEKITADIDKTADQKDIPQTNRALMLDFSQEEIFYNDSNISGEQKQKQQKQPTTEQYGGVYFNNMMRPTKVGSGIQTLKPKLLMMPTRKIHKHKSEITGSNFTQSKTQIANPLELITSIHKTASLINNHNIDDQDNLDEEIFADEQYFDPDSLNYDDLDEEVKEEKKDGTTDVIEEQEEDNQQPQLDDLDLPLFNHSSNQQKKILNPQRCFSTNNYSSLGYNNFQQTLQLTNQLMSQQQNKRQEAGQVHEEQSQRRGTTQTTTNSNLFRRVLPQRISSFAHGN